MKLWDKGIAGDKLVGEFTAGEDRKLDIRLAGYDVLGSIAHVKMLSSIGLLSASELKSLEDELKHLFENIREGRFEIQEGVEDVHSQVELMLTEALGETGKKVHTARSRNDQVLVDIKLFARDKLKEIVMQTRSLFNLLISLSNEHRNVLMPGYTHMQVAMPSSFGLWFGAYAESLTDDLTLLLAAYRIVNQNPLGSGAGFGSSFPVNRTMTTDLLGFECMHVNVVSAQMNRGKMEKITSFAIASIGSTLSKMAMDICMYSGQNFRFLSLPEEFTTGSSIMPHKKNPDVFELIRAKGNKLQALPNEIAMISTNLPSGYHRDMQLIKESFIPSFDVLLEIISISELLIGKIKINKDIITGNLYRDLFSVEVVNRLVLEGSSFRDAYRTIGKKIADGSYNPDTKLDHTHEGSMGNLSNGLIQEKMEKLITAFDFRKADDAIMKLIK
ncbi:MAG: argininosuccinate lyase [Bacteroidales bacterium]